MRTRLARLLLAAARRLDRDGSVVPQGATRTVEIEPTWWQVSDVNSHAEIVAALDRRPLSRRPVDRWTLRAELLRRDETRPFET